MANIQITREEIRKAKEWLVENEEAWEGNRFLIPESEVPDYVIKYFAFWDARSDAYVEKMRILSSMGIDDGPEEIDWTEEDDD